MVQACDFGHEVSMVCLSNACANNLYSFGFITGGLSYPGDLAGWLLHALTPKRDKKMQIYYTHHLQTQSGFVIIIWVWKFVLMRFLRLNATITTYTCFNCTFVLGNQCKCQTAVILNVYKTNLFCLPPIPEDLSDDFLSCSSFSPAHTYTTE